MTKPNHSGGVRCWYCSKQSSEGEWIWLWGPTPEDLEGAGLVSVTEGVFLTLSELEERERRAFEAERIIADLAKWELVPAEAIVQVREMIDRELIATKAQGGDGLERSPLSPEEMDMSREEDDDKAEGGEGE